MAQEHRPRARDAGLTVGVLPPGPLNAITDVAGVLVGHATLIRARTSAPASPRSCRTRAICFAKKSAGAVFVGNGFGKLAGSTQVNELGEIETPILLTSTLNVPRVADALLDYMLALPGNEDVRSINPVVAETNDGYLNDIRGRHVGRAEVFAAIQGAKSGPVEEGAVGAGTGTVAFGFKGGIGTSSRRLPASLGGYTVGVLVQTNYGGVLTIAGAPGGPRAGPVLLEGRTRTRRRAEPGGWLGDCGDRDRRAGRPSQSGAHGGALDDGPGAHRLRGLERQRRLRHRVQHRPRRRRWSSNDAMSPLFLAVIEATEEAVYNSLFRATTMTGNGHTVEALPVDKTIAILRKHGAIR